MSAVIGQVSVRTSGGVEIRDSYVERRNTLTQRHFSSTAKTFEENVRVTPNATAPKYRWSNSRDYLAGNENMAEPGAGLNSSWAALPARQSNSTLPPIVLQAVIGVNFIADHLKQQDEFNKVCISTEQWYEKNEFQVLPWDVERIRYE